MKNSLLKRFLPIAAVLVSVIAVCNSASAALLNLNQQFPDLTLANLTVSYVAAGGTFTANGGAPTKLEPDGVNPAVLDFVGASASIVLHLNPANGALIDGSLSVTGTIPSLGFNSGTLLTGDAQLFGFNDVSPPPVGMFEIVFKITGGQLQAPYFPSYAGIILTGNGGATYPGVFTDNFSFAARTGAGDLFPTPEPSGFVIMGLGAVGMSLRRRGRRNRLG